MHAYCVESLGLSDDAAAKRIHAARAARQYPALFTALAQGRLHLTAVWLLAPHLTTDNAGELVDAAAHRRKSEIEEMLASRFSKGLEPPRAPWSVRALPSVPPPVSQHVSAPEGCDLFATRDEHAPGHAADTRDQHAPGHVAKPDAAAPLSPQRFLLRATIAKSTYDKLRHAQALLRHTVPSGDVALVLDRALDVLIVEIERRKLGAAPTGRPLVRRGTPGSREPHRPQGSPGARATPSRYIPAHVRRAVWERDQGQCTFVGTSVHRCNALRFLQFDHIDPVARRGNATVEQLRLRCRAHNQLEAERVFGVEFMNRKREEAKVEAEAARERAVRPPGS